MPELFRRLLSDADPLAPECAYLTDDEIKSCFQWFERDLGKAVMEDLFALCQEFLPAQAVRES